jgi:hypothetical protein
MNNKELLWKQIASKKDMRRKMFEIKNKRNENRMFAMPLKLYFIFIFISLFLQSTKRFSAPRVFLYGSSYTQRMNDWQRNINFHSSHF